MLNLSETLCLCLIWIVKLPTLPSVQLIYVTVWHQRQIRWEEPVDEPRIGGIKFFHELKVFSLGNGTSLPLPLFTLCLQSPQICSGGLGENAEQIFIWGGGGGSGSAGEKTRWRSCIAIIQTKAIVLAEGFHWTRPMEFSLTLLLFHSG